MFGSRTAWVCTFVCLYVCHCVSWPVKKIKRKEKRNKIVSSAGEAVVDSFTNYIDKWWKAKDDTNGSRSLYMVSLVQMWGNSFTAWVGREILCYQRLWMFKACEIIVPTRTYLQLDTDAARNSSQLSGTPLRLNNDATLAAITSKMDMRLSLITMSRQYGPNMAI